MSKQTGCGNLAALSNPEDGSLEALRLRGDPMQQKCPLGIWGLLPNGTSKSAFCALIGHVSHAASRAVLRAHGGAVPTTAVDLPWMQAPCREATGPEGPANADQKWGIPSRRLHLHHSLLPLPLNSGWLAGWLPRSCLEPMQQSAWPASSFPSRIALSVVSQWLRRASDLPPAAFRPVLAAFPAWLLGS